MEIAFDSSARSLDAEQFADQSSEGILNRQTSPSIPHWRNRRPFDALPKEEKRAEQLRDIWLRGLSAFSYA